MSRIGLVAEGGGMKCAYGAGVLDIFLDNGITFDYSIGVSAGSANLASYLAGQRDRNKRFYTDHIKEPLYFGLKPFLETGNLFNLQYIYGTLSNEDGADYVDYDAIMNNPCAYEVVATDALTGKPAYFSKKDLVRNDLRIIMASSAIPAVSKPVTVGGRPYYDGGVSDAIPVTRAMSQGCDKLVVILSKPRSYVKAPEKNRLLYNLMCRKYPSAIKALNNRHLMYKKDQEAMFELERQGKAFIFSLETDLKMSTFTMDAGINEQLYALGVKDASEKMDALKAFMAD